jgi:hypothetical protein
MPLNCIAQRTHVAPFKEPLTQQILNERVAMGGLLSARGKEWHARLKRANS